MYGQLLAHRKLSVSSGTLAAWRGLPGCIRAASGPSTWLEGVLDSHTFAYQHAYRHASNKPLVDLRQRTRCLLLLWQ